jgi:flagellar protein FliS
MRARLHMENGNVAERGVAISKAIDIVESGLKAAVNKEAGGQVAQSLIHTYDVITYNLLQANLRGSAEKLNTAERMLVEVSDAWKQATENLPGPASPASVATAG